jgi:murein DD-endopeptidase MepM/ murein hydrolase activator NlpD
MPVDPGVRRFGNRCSDRAGSTRKLQRHVDVGASAESGVRLFANTWVNDPSSPIQYPFPVGVPISPPSGPSRTSRSSPPHNGVDLTPGEGAEIHAVAAGTVRIATESGGDYGVTVLIDHIIDGQLVSTSATATCSTARCR